MIIVHQKWFVYLGLLAGLALWLGACNSLPWAPAAAPTPVPTVTNDGRVSAEGRLAPVRSVALSFQSNGELGELLVSEGDLVEQGAVLARLGKTEALQAALSQAKLEQLSAQQALDDLKEKATLARQEYGKALSEARAALNEAQHTLNNLDTDDFQEDLDERNLDVQEAKEELDDKKEELDKYQDLDPDNATRKNAQTDYDDALLDYNNAVYERDKLQNQLEQARADVALATARLEDAQREYDQRQAGPDPDDLALAETRVAAANAQVDAAQRALDNAELVAPWRGTVADLNDMDPGESVVAGRTVLTLADFSAWVVETRDLTELDVVAVEPGQAVRVIPDALPGLELGGTVESIDRVFTERSGDILYTVRIRLAEGDPRLRWGMTVEVVFAD